MHQGIRVGDSEWSSSTTLKGDECKKIDSQPAPSPAPLRSCAPVCAPSHFFTELDVHSTFPLFVLERTVLEVQFENYWYVGASQGV